MIAWFTGNWPTVAAAAAVLFLTVLSIRNLLPGKHRASCCGNCAGCSAGCSRRNGEAGALPESRQSRGE